MYFNDLVSDITRWHIACFLLGHRPGPLFEFKIFWLFI
jgi:hypothetical protein